MTNELRRWRHRIDLGDVIQSPRGEYVLWGDYDKLGMEFERLRAALTLIAGAKGVRGCDEIARQALDGHEPSSNAAPGATLTGESSVRLSAEDSRPRELQPSEAASFGKTLARSPRRVEPSAHAPSEAAMQIISAVCHGVSGTCVHLLKDSPGACTIENCSAVRAYLGAPSERTTANAQ